MFVPITISSEVEYKEKTNPLPQPRSPFLSFSSLSDDIIINILARISVSYYPKLSLVSKTFYSHILSFELHHERIGLGTNENVPHVCLQLPTSCSPSWFALWIKPEQTLTNDLENKNKSTRNTFLVSIPSPCSPRLPHKLFTIGSETYAINRNYGTPSTRMWICNKDDPYISAWRKAPNMKVARESTVAGVLDEKIYVMGGCRSDESKHWAEVFDPKTQTWESLPDPSAELRSSSIKRMAMYLEKICIISSLNTNYFYHPKESRWEVMRKELDLEGNCFIENVSYSCGNKGVLWHDMHRQVRNVNGLDVLNRSCPFGMIGIANYGGNLLVFWDKLVLPHQCEKKEIWCAMISLERRNNGDEVWGDVVWASPVFTVPSSYVSLRCLVHKV